MSRQVQTGLGMTVLTIHVLVVCVDSPRLGTYFFLVKYFFRNSVFVFRHHLKAVFLTYYFFERL